MIETILDLIKSDENPQGEKLNEIYNAATTEEKKAIDKVLICLCGYSFNRLLAKKLWSKLGNIPIDDDQESIELPFEVPEKNITFEIGTPNTDIWHWFEDTFDLCVAEDLMYINSKTQI